MGKSKYICSNCGEPIEEGELMFGDHCTYYEDKPLCYDCYYEDEPAATIFYGSNEEPYRISDTRNETDCDFWVEWKPSDPWRGRYEVKSKKYRKLFSDSILAYHESENMLKELNDLVMNRFNEMNLDYARSFARTSNVFCTDYDIWAKDELMQIIKGLVVLESAKKTVGYDDPVYSTGIIFNREELKKLQSVFKDKYNIENDSDILGLLQENRDFYMEIIRKLYGNEFSDD